MQNFNIYVYMYLNEFDILIKLKSIVKQVLLKSYLTL